MLASLTEGQLLLTLSGLFPTAPSTMTDDDAAQIARACFGLDSYFVRETDVCAVGALFRGSLRVADAETALARVSARPRARRRRRRRRRRAATRRRFSLQKAEALAAPPALPGGCAASTASS